MSSDEDDYMSDAFLNGLTEVRPSLIQDRGKKRQVQIEAKKVEFNKKPKINQSNERLQEGLKCPIESENKGFKLLAKMGYKPGDSLGKSSTSGIKEPIGINVKSDRSGFGREAALKEIETKRREIRAKHLQRQINEPEVTPEEYRRRMTEKAQERFVESALRKCQKSCEDLDHKANVDEPHLKWFWPDRTPPPAEDDKSEAVEEEDEEDDDAFEYSAAEKLEMLTSYMRTSYNYCHWCGVHYKDLDDLDSNCPGLTKDDH
ncbi:G patch domain-containing protein 11 [Episyrphus balteatus]|uniref:G patch domain-containing protein 11 n=1 Tax=Episyrphus balteatus TaxID=286459 RepID=UPI0024864E9B|nr:G patch domain-containing protein 11 [Episyrphus balteatus]